jgi:hypothetical protein
MSGADKDSSVASCQYFLNIVWNVIPDRHVNRSNLQISSIWKREHLTDLIQLETNLTYPIGSPEVLTTVGFCDQTNSTSEYWPVACRPPLCGNRNIKATCFQTANFLSVCLRRSLVYTNRKVSRMDQYLCRNRDFCFTGDLKLRSSVLDIRRFYCRRRNVSRGNMCTECNIAYSPLILIN